MRHSLQKALWRSGRGPNRLAGAVLALSLLFASVAAGAETTRLEGLRIEALGRLARITFQADRSLEEFTLSRQGPPNKRDLVMTLHSMVQGLQGTGAEGTPPGMHLPFTVSAGEEDGTPYVRIVFEMAGDSLVRLEHGRGSLALVLIPQEGDRPRSADAYMIGADDVLAVSVFGHDDLTKTVKVSPDGLINYPLIGNVRASGRSVDEVAEEIRSKLGTDFLVEPHVTVSIWEYLSQWVNVVGEVLKPGRYYMTGPTTLIDAISQAGGLNPEAGEWILVTRRPGESDPAAAGEVLRFSTESLMGQKEGASAFRIRAGDVVNVLSGDTARQGESGSAGTR